MSLEGAIQDARKALNRDLIAARLGDNGQGNPYDLDTPGNYWVQKVEANGNLSQPISLPIYSNANIPPKAGLAVYIGYDEFGTQCIWRASRTGLLSADISPLILNPLDTAVYGKVNGANIANFFCQRHGDTTNYPLTVVVFPGAIERADTMQIFSGATVDLSALVPGDDLHCYAVVFIKTDLTLEAFASTPVALTEPLTDVDISEAIAQRTADSLTIWAWELFDEQTVLSPDPTKNVDLRQWLNIPGTGGAMTSFNVAGDTGTPATISDGDTLTFVGTNGVATSISGDTVTIDGTITSKEIFNEWTETGTPSANTLWVYATDDNGFTVWRLIDSTGTVLQTIRDQIVVAKNTTGSSIAAGSAVKINTVASGVSLMVKSIATNDTVNLADGVVMDATADNAFGRVMLRGIMPLDTSGYSAGALLYLSAATSGLLTATSPSSGAGWIQIVAQALDSSASGHLLVNPKTRLDHLYTANLNVGTKTNTNINFFVDATHVLNLIAPPISANRAITLPDATGTVVLNDNTVSLTNKKYGSGSSIAADAVLDMVSTTLGGRPAPVMTVAQRDAISSPAEGLMIYCSDTDELSFYDGQRWRAVEGVGWSPFAFPISYNPSAAFADGLSVAAVSGVLAVPMLVPSHMLLEAVSVTNLNTALARSWTWGLYKQYLNNGNSGENTLTQVAVANGSDAFTATAVSIRTITATSAPIYLAPGVYWLVIQNNHASNVFSVGSTAVAARAAFNTGQTKTLGAGIGSTLDFVASTWVKTSDVVAVVCKGRVFGQTTSF